jgi:hypothetical protein
MPILTPTTSAASPAPAASGTVSNTAIDVATVIEHAVRKCGVLASSITGEQLRSARENLFLILTGLSNRGVNLWCVEKQVLPVTAYDAKVPLWAGTVDILNAQLRYGTYTQATSYAGATASLTLSSAAVVYSASVMIPTSGTYSLVLEYSNDGATWAQAGSLAMLRPSAVGDQIGVDTDNFVSAIYWRVRETALNVTFAAVTFVTSATEITMAPMNRDDYKSMPNKGYATTYPLQYWYDKQTSPVIWLWPVPQTNGPQIVLTTQRHIQDVGGLSNTLDVPKRWHLSIIHELAAMTCMELPAAQVPPGRLEQLTALAQRFTKEAEDGEVDGAPMRIAPSIRAYTRG